MLGGDKEKNRDAAGVSGVDDRTSIFTSGQKESVGVKGRTNSMDSMYSAKEKKPKPRRRDYWGNRAVHS